ncbi:hypothetical protein [Microlunatus sp. Gsoil 973]|uniref:hypothetical protein n=1 Tax=Microlunatus sp. Gsoil 973 TaxID=2672569 RepID=UPI0012B4D7AE|nr:hypothetical protein [Microlunatus sp. Gsoil 973]QGN31556.1 hypothetical protein GJV80_00490 [Microlunatus sp. Gsoil 973]
MLPAGLALLTGLDAALVLLGLPAPVSTDRLPQVHGMLLVIGFVGTVIALERAIALRRPYGFSAPVLTGLGSVLLLSPAPLPVGKSVQLLGMIALIAVYVPLWRRQRDVAVLVQAFGAVLAVGALTLWLGGSPVPVLLPWLIGFIVLTIAGERLELARLSMSGGADRNLALLGLGLTVGVVSSLLWPPVGYPLLGLSLIGLTCWLAAHDVARRTIRSGGLPRFIAGCMLAGYLWLAVAGSVWLTTGPAWAGARYDAVVHAVFLGFTISMIMAHAPVIMPAVLRRPLPYRPVMWAAAFGLHASLLTRLWVGDSLGVRAVWQAAGVVNILSLLVFLMIAIWSAARAGNQR